MPDLAQLGVLAFAIVPGFIAAGAQSFASMRQAVHAFEKTLLAIVYSAILYLIASFGSWGPQFSSAFVEATNGSRPIALLSTDLLLRYLALLILASVLGLATGRSLARGRLRRIVARVTGRNITASTWQEFLRDRHQPGLWIQLRDGRRIVGVPIAASDRLDERLISLAYPKWVEPSGRLQSMNLETLMVDAHDGLFVGQLGLEDVPGATAETT